MIVYLKSILAILKENMSFLFTYCLIFLAFFLYYFMNNKGDEIYFLNSFHSDTNDILFKFSSDFAEGIYYALILIILGMFSFKFLFNGVLTYLISGGVTQILKRIFDFPRPKLYFGSEILANLHLVEGVKIYTKYSFPSGHSTAAFSMMFFLSLIVPNKYAKILFAIFAAIMGISRIYLVQHFLVDVIVGSVVGIVVTLLTYKFVLSQRKIVNSKWYNFSVIEKIYKRKYENE